MKNWSSLFLRTTDGFGRERKTWNFCISSISSQITWHGECEQVISTPRKSNQINKPEREREREVVSLGDRERKVTNWTRKKKFLGIIIKDFLNLVNWLW
jgi:hypothetical protein